MALNTLYESRAIATTATAQTTTTMGTQRPTDRLQNYRTEAQTTGGQTDTDIHV